MSVKRVGQFLASLVIIFLITVLLKYRLGNLGYLNISLTAIIILCRHYAPSYAIILAGLPTAAADLVLKCGYYAPYTFIIKGLSGFLTAWLAGGKKLKNSTVFLLGAIEALGYLLTDLYLFGSRTMALYSLLYSLIQIVLCAAALGVYNLIIRKR